MKRETNEWEVLTVSICIYELQKLENQKKVLGPEIKTKTFFAKQHKHLERLAHPLRGKSTIPKPPSKVAVQLFDVSNNYLLENSSW